MLRRALWDRFVVETGPGMALALGVGVLAGLGDRRTRSLAAVAVLGGLGVLLLGLGIQGLRPYHLRAVMPLLAVAVGVSVSLRPGLLVALAGCVAAMGVRWTAPPAPDGGVTGVDAFGAALAAVDVPVQVEAVWFGDPVGVEPGAVVLSARQHGLEPERQLAVDGSGPVVVIVNLADDPTASGLVREARIWPELDAAATAAWPDVRVLRAESLEEARTWLQSTEPPPVVTGGSFDWVKAFKPSASGHQSI